MFKKNFLPPMRSIVEHKQGSGVYLSQQHIAAVSRCVNRFVD